ncbi:MAG: hypothetical protein JWN29_4092 [Acidimicrobiales bacterium]|nr:hypothetical protein [Acidimicrobiales bacterium]
MADIEDAPEPTEIDLAPPPVPRKANRRVALVLGALAVVAGGAFAALSLGGESNSPEEPVRAMFAAVERGDVLGVLEQLDPGERDALRQPLTDLVSELNRLDVLKGADLGHVTGMELKVDGLELKTTAVRNDLTRVAISGGKGNYRFDASKLPLGGFIRDLAGDSLDATSSGSDTLASDTGGDFLTTVKRGDRWYVSIGYSVAEQARRDAGVSIDALGPGVPAKGADSPEDAVRQLVEAGTTLDVRRIIELLPPDELAAVHDYAGLFIDDAAQAADEAKSTVDIQMSKLDLASDVSGDHGLVFVRDAAVSASADGTSFQYRDGCVDIRSAEVEPQHICNTADPTELFKTFGLRADLEPPKLSFEGKQAKVGIAVTRVDGRWYVSPTRTVLGGLVSELRLFQPGDLVALRDWFQQVVDQVGSSITIEGGSGDGSIPAPGGPPTTALG